MAAIGPGRALVVLVAAAGLGIGSYVAVDALSDQPSKRVGDQAAPGASGGIRDPEPAAPETEPEDGASAGGPSGPGASQPGRTLSPSASAPTETPEASLEPSAPTAPPTTPSADPLFKKWRDVTPPRTSLSQELPAPDSARFTFAANESASFGCSLDGAAFTPCTSPVSYSGLNPGWHTFSVTAVDDSGNADHTPAKTRWLAKDDNATDQ